MDTRWKRLIPVCLLLAFSAACEKAQLSDLEKEAKEVVDGARMKAKELGELSEEEIQKIWAIEYKTIRVSHTEQSVLDEKLNKLGKERWDCYHVSEDGEGRVFYLKRRESNALRYFTDLLRLGSWAF